MAFTSFVDHAVSIWTLIAAFLARTAIFANCIPRELLDVYQTLSARVRGCGYARLGRGMPMLIMHNYSLFSLFSRHISRMQSF